MQNGEADFSKDLNVRFSRRSSLALGGLGLLGGCSFVRKSPFFSTIATFNKSANAPITRARINSIPYASMLSWFDGSARALIVLGEYLPDDRLVWYSADRQAVTTWGPFVLTLVGTDIDLRSTSLTGQWTKNPLELIGRRLARSADFQAQKNRASFFAVSRFELGGLEEVEIFDEVKKLRRIREHVTAAKWHEYSNDYWVDEVSGQWWKARQLIIPTMKPLNTVLTKRPQRG